MAKRNVAPGKLTVCNLSESDETWLKAESEKLGCDPENFVRIIIRQRMAPLVMAPPPNGGGYPESETYYEQSYMPPPPVYSGAPAHVAPEAEPLPVPDVEIPADPDSDEPNLDQLMRAAPSFLDHAAEQRPTPRTSAYQPQRRFQPAYREQPARNVVPLRAAVPYVGGAFGAFSLTQPLGLGQNISRGNMMGDAASNVMRDNSRWIGFAGSRRR